MLPRPPRPQDDGSVVAHVSDVIVLSRADRRKDRVEVSAVQLSKATEEAEMSSACAC